MFNSKKRKQKQLLIDLIELSYQAMAELKQDILDHYQTSDDLKFYFVRDQCFFIIGSLVAISLEAHRSHFTTPMTSEYLSKILNTYTHEAELDKVSTGEELLHVFNLYKEQKLFVSSDQDMPDDDDQVTGMFLNIINAIHQKNNVESDPRFTMGIYIKLISVCQNVNDKIDSIL